jgi:hypothetical protein
MGAAAGTVVKFSNNAAAVGAATDCTGVKRTGKTVGVASYSAASKAIGKAAGVAAPRWQ